MGQPPLAALGSTLRVKSALHHIDDILGIASPCSLSHAGLGMFAECMLSKALESRRYPSYSGFQWLSGTLLLWLSMAFRHPAKS